MSRQIGSLKILLSTIIMAAFISSCKTSKSTAVQSGSSFSSVEQKLIESGTATSPMRLFLLTNAQDSILLRKKSSRVTPDPLDTELQLFIDRLYTTVRDSMSLGVGIAAPQVGVLKQIIWVQRFDKPEFPFEVYLNPKIIQYTKKTQPCMEGCLSIPDKQAETKNRAYAILLEYDKLDGSHHVEMVEDFTAVIFQHEIDHLNGIVFLDHLEEESK